MIGVALGLRPRNADASWLFVSRECGRLNPPTELEAV
jgi:hypothetical protein